MSSSYRCSSPTPGYPPPSRREHWRLLGGATRLSPSGVFDQGAFVRAVLVLIVRAPPTTPALSTGETRLGDVRIESEPVHVGVMGNAHKSSLRDVTPLSELEAHVEVN
ncbi:MAG: hypothetical protein ACYC19_11850, partial [Acidimicrobiales bacterium]